MTHLSENSHRLTIINHIIHDFEEIQKHSLSDVVMVVLPADGQFQNPLVNAGDVVASVVRKLSKNATLIVLGETVDLVSVASGIHDNLTYQLWIAIKTNTPKLFPNTLPRNHFGALVYTSHKTLRHTKTRVAYTYCPACSLSTKDYGGKKHTYNPYGTLLSDVWKDIPTNLEGNLTEIYKRFADLFGIEDYQPMTIFDCRNVTWQREEFTIEPVAQVENQLPCEFKNLLMQGDCLENLQRIPDNSIDFAFADPPYNLEKKYNGYADDLNIQQYFEWCDEWLHEMFRVLKPGRTLAVLNIPLWAIRQFQFLQQHMLFQNWIVWDALSFPVRKIMPAHYAILTFTKGKPRKLPGLETDSPYLRHLIDGYCIRKKCVTKRHAMGVNDTEPLTDVWADIHRIKHNSRRVDHPCQLPPKLMYRLISVFTNPGEVVLDPFNGAGTTSLTAQQMGRIYIGIELDARYHQLTISRHEELNHGIDPFRKEKRELTAKNSRVERVKIQKYIVPKKVLQLEVKRVAKSIGHIPNRNEMIQYGTYPITYYDNYFTSWGEVTSAARNGGMSEKPVSETQKQSYDTPNQPSLF